MIGPCGTTLVFFFFFNLTLQKDEYQNFYKVQGPMPNKKNCRDQGQNMMKVQGLMTHLSLAFKMVSLELTTVFSVGKGEKHAGTSFGNDRRI